MAAERLSDVGEKCKKHRKIVDVAVVDVDEQVEVCGRGGREARESATCCVAHGRWLVEGLRLCCCWWYQLLPKNFFEGVGLRTSQKIVPGGYRELDRRPKP